MAVECRKVCGEIRLLTREGIVFVAAATYCLNLKRTPAPFKGLPYRLTKMGSSSPRGRLFKKALSSSTVSGQSGQIRSLRPFPCNRTCNGDSQRKARGERFNAS